MVEQTGAAASRDGVSTLPGKLHTGSWGSQPLSIGTLNAADSPRLAGESVEHVRLLAGSDSALPPILVHRSTMRVIDGMHRLRAAQLRGEETIEVTFFDGTDDEAFVAAIRANVTHGLPLTQADREAAATRLIASHAHCSDRWIAAVTGLAARTVATLRRRSQPDPDPAATRVGLDGRTRPVNSAHARRLAGQAVIERPEASLREIARTTGLSPTTVRDVRERIRRGDDPVANGRLANDRIATSEPAPITAAPASGSRRRSEPATGPSRQHRRADRVALMENLSRDPSLRFTEAGRALLRALFAHAKSMPRLELLELLPPHCAYTLAMLARACAQEWQDVADELTDRFRMDSLGAR
jgi:hypothetical protein